MLRLRKPTQNQLNLHYSTCGYISRANVAKRKISRSCSFTHYKFFTIMPFVTFVHSQKMKRTHRGGPVTNSSAHELWFQPIPKGVWQRLLAQLAWENPAETTRFYANLWITRMFIINMFDVSPCKKIKTMALFSCAVSCSPLRDKVLGYVFLFAY